MSTTPDRRGSASGQPLAKCEPVAKTISELVCKPLVPRCLHDNDSFSNLVGAAQILGNNSVARAVCAHTVSSVNQLVGCAAANAERIKNHRLGCPRRWR